MRVRIILIAIILIIIPLRSFALDYIIDTDVGGDIDDAIALILAANSESKPIAVTTTHIDPVEKARIAKLILTEQGHPEIPVYAGIGVNRDGSNALFKQQNSLWPPFYGYPNPGENERNWYEKQAIAYKDAYGSQFNAMQIESETASEFIVRLAKQYSSKHKLTIVALGPLHNIAAALMLDPSISDHIVIYSMGGVYPKGYNWLISPETTAKVLKQTETYVISSDFIAENELYVSANEFETIEKDVHTSFGSAFIADWKNWYKIDAVHKTNTQLGDPVTLYIATHPNEVTMQSNQVVEFPCLDENGKLKSEFNGVWYSKSGLENKIVKLKSDDSSHTHFIMSVKSVSTIKSWITSGISKHI